jgi:hypothetical protein
MWADLSAVQQHFASYVATHGDRGPAGQIAAWLSTGELDPAGFASIVEREGCARDVWFRKQMLDLVLGFLSAADEGALLTAATIHTAGVLKRALHVREGDFLRWRSAEVSALIVAHVEIMLDDGALSEGEDLYCVELQALFDLSLDQYFRLARPAFERAWNRVTGRIEDPLLTMTARRQAVFTVQMLRPLYELAQVQSRTPGALY